MARRMVRDGIDADALARVWALAREVGESPGGLFACWIDRRQIVAKLAELRLAGNAVKLAGDEKVSAAALVERVARQLRRVE